MIFQDGLLAVANERLNGTELRVLLVILAWTDYQNRVGCTQSAIASRLGISPQQVCAAMAVLAKRALIYKTYVVDRGMTVWYVSPILAWRGTPQNHASAAAKAPQGIPV